MAKGVINLQKESGGVTKITSTDGTGITELVLPESGVVAKTSDINTAGVATVLLGVGFPIACELGKRWNFNKKFGILSLSRGWENQELVYGLIQGLVFWLVVL